MFIYLLVTNIVWFVKIPERMKNYYNCDLYMSWKVFKDRMYDKFDKKMTIW